MSRRTKTRGLLSRTRRREGSYARLLAAIAERKARGDTHPQMEVHRQRLATILGYQQP